GHAIGSVPDFPADRAVRVLYDNIHISLQAELRSTAHGRTEPPQRQSRFRALHWHETGERRRWSDTLTFVLAVAGASIGFKTIWQLPYIVSNNGGGAFILIYLLLAFTVGAPLLMAQAMLGRRAHASPVKAMSELGAGVLG